MWELVLFLHLVGQALWQIQSLCFSYSDTCLLDRVKTRRKSVSAHLDPLKRVVSDAPFP